MFRSVSFGVLLTVGFLLSSCSSAPRVRQTIPEQRPWVGQIISPSQTIERVDWVDKEKASDVAIRRLWATEEASFQIVRLNTAERPHTHDHHDLTIFVLQGEANLHLEDQMVEVETGDVIAIPRGTPHWARNTSSGSSEVYAIFTPPFDGKDTRYLDE